MFRFAIIDDNREDRLRLINEINEYTKYHHIQISYDEYDDPLSYDFHKSYDCIFLDIDMPEKNGTTLGREIHKKSNTRIIFVSSFDEYLYASLDAGAFHFIHKSDLRNETSHVLNILFKQFNDSSILLDTKRGKQNIMLKDIMYFVTEDKLTYVYTHNDKYEIWESLSSLYDKYKYFNFEKVNQSTLINLHYVQTYDDKTVILTDSSQFSLSHRLKKNFIGRYEDYLLGISQ